MANFKPEVFLPLPDLKVWVVLRAEKSPQSDPETNKQLKGGRSPCSRTPNPRSFLLLEHSFQSTLSTPRGLASWLLLEACSTYPGW